MSIEGSQWTRFHLRNEATKQYCHTLDWMISMTYIHYETLESPMHDSSHASEISHEGEVSSERFYGTVRNDAKFASHKLCHRIHRTLYFHFQYQQIPHSTRVRLMPYTMPLHLPPLPPSVCRNSSIKYKMYCFVSYLCRRTTLGNVNDSPAVVFAPPPPPSIFCTRLFGDRDLAAAAVAAVGDAP